MVKRNKKEILLTVGCLLALTLAGLLTSPKVSAAIRATFVEVVIPSTPFYGKIALSPQHFVLATGPDTGTLAVTSITVTNFDSARNNVFIFAPLFAGAGGCGSAITGGTSLNFTIFVEPFSTRQLPTPRPWCGDQSRDIAVLRRRRPPTSKSM